MTTLPDRIRAAIAESHVAIEETDFAKNMVSGTIDQDTYLLGLYGLLHIHQCLESSLASQIVSNQLIQDLYNRETMSRVNLIQNDILHLGGEIDSQASIDSACRKYLQDLSISKPWALIGALYVMEGSRMGSMVIVRKLGPALGLECSEGVGLDYHLSGIATRPRDWQQFRGKLSAMTLTPEQENDILDCAVYTMNTLLKLYSDIPTTIGCSI